MKTFAGGKWALRLGVVAVIAFLCGSRAETQDPALKPTPADIATASRAADDLLKLRFSTPLFRLGSAKLIEQKVTFPGSGPDADPGVIVMAIDDEPGELPAIPRRHRGRRVEDAASRVRGPCPEPYRDHHGQEDE